MTAPSAESAQLLRRAATRAMRAPSVHNTQPWRLRIAGDSLDLSADWDRKLAVLDPVGRQLLISCGCAVLNARVAIAAAGRRSRTELFPPRTGAVVTARLTLDDDGEEPDASLAILGPLIDLRQTNRREFVSDGLDDALVDLLVAAAAAEGAILVPLARGDHKLAAARLTQRADREQNADPAYRAELRMWTTDDPQRPDGVPDHAIPHVTGALSELPIRDFDARGTGGLPDSAASGVAQHLFVLCTQDDRPAAWVRAGQALERVWLEVTRHAFALSLFTQPIEVPWIRDALQRELGLPGMAHMLLRVGRAARTPRTARRPLADVLVETDRSDR